MSNISRDPNELLFIGTHGHVIAVRKSDGETVWSTSLPKTGYSIVAIVPEDGMLLCGSGGHTFALDPTDGRILWTNSLKGMGSGITYLATMQNQRGSGMTNLAAQAAANAAAASAAT